jgi:glutamate/tyrosine decarboxylase-like PLP-dependent enzyme
MTGIWADGTLDPSDWDAFGEQASFMLRDALDYVRTVRQRPVWRPVPDEIRNEISGEDLPREGQPLDAVYDAFRQWILPYPTGNIHPRFWGWVMGSGTPVSFLADMLAAAMNAHVAGYDQSAALVERRVIGWLAELMGYPPAASGLLVSGGTSANLHGLTIARNSKLPFDVRARGIQGAPPLRVYASVEAHSWLKRACELLGIGAAGLRLIPVDENYEIRLDELERAVDEDRRSGILPFCVVGNAGTVNTGATDDLNALADICASRGLWFHVDGAFGALVRLSPSYAGLAAGIERADSIAFDLHKWPSMNYEIGAIVFRDDDAARQSFATAPSYLQPAGGGIAVEPMWFADRGIQLSRGFRALKAWFSMKTYGVQTLGESIAKNIRQAHFVARFASEHDELELLAPAPMNVVNIRYRPHRASEERLNTLNQRILLELQVRGIAVPSSTVLDGRFALRLAITNHRTQDEDVRFFLNEMIKIGREICAASPDR